MRIIILVIFCISISCSKEQSQSTVEIQNETNFELDSVIVTIDSTNLRFRNLKPQDKSKQTLSVMDLKKGHNDNAFGLAIYVKDSLVRIGTFGYFTHGNVKEKYIVTVFDNFQFKEN